MRTRLQQKIEQERQQIEAVTQSELRKLEESLRRSVNNALDTIDGDIRRISAMHRQAWIRPLVIGLMLVLSIAGGSWGLMGWLSHSIESHIRTRAALQVEIEAQEKTIERLRDKTWQVDLHEDKNGKFVVMPEGEPHHWDQWEFRGRPAWRLKDK